MIFLYKSSGFQNINPLYSLRPANRNKIIVNKYLFYIYITFKVRKEYSKAKQRRG